MSRFSSNRQTAQYEYRDFVEAGIEQGKREELGGCGLIRSAGGAVELLLRDSASHEMADERILGGGDFVESVLQTKNTVHSLHHVSVDDILTEIAERSGMNVEIILGQSRERTVCKVRKEFYQRAHDEAGEVLH